jgi:nucleotide-binding universal stress UspA family protein
MQGMWWRSFQKSFDTLEAIPMLRKILAAMDSSEMSPQVFDHALVLAQATGACLRLLHVANPGSENIQDLPLHLVELTPYPWNGQQDLSYFTGSFESLEASFLEACITKAQTNGVPAEYFQCLGDPGSTICNFALAWGADLIVIGRRGRVGMVELLLGSVSNYVVHHAPCSVQVVHWSIAEDSIPIPEHAAGLVA